MLKFQHDRIADDGHKQQYFYAVDQIGPDYYVVTCGTGDNTTILEYFDDRDLAVAEYNNLVDSYAIMVGLGR